MFSCDRHALRARINSRDALGDALEASYKKLKHYVDTQENDLDQDIKARWPVQRSHYNSALTPPQVTHLPDHLQFLVCKMCPIVRDTLSRTGLAYNKSTTLASNG